MANYQSTKALETEIDGLRNTRGSGLLQAMRNLKQRNLEKKLGAVEQSNDDLKAQELAMLLRGDRTGRVGDSYVARRADQFIPRHPELVEALRSEGVNAKARDRTASIAEFEQSQKNPAFGEFLRSQRSAADPSDLEMYMGMSPEDRAAALEFRRNPYLDQGDQYTNVTRPDDVVPINVSPDNLPSTRGAQAAAVQAAETAAMPDQLAIQNAAEADKARQLAAVPVQRDAQATLSLLDMAEPLLETATGSGLGALRDQAGALVGLGGEGAEAAAQLKAIGGLLVSKMPRMQGPQSNLDVQLYREMAGQIGDPTVPNDVRLAAIKTIRALNEKYAGQPAAAQPAQPGADDPISAADEILRQAGIIQ